MLTLERRFGSYARTVSSIVAGSFNILVQKPSFCSEVSRRNPSHFRSGFLKWLFLAVLDSKIRGSKPAQNRGLKTSAPFFAVSKNVFGGEVLAKCEDERVV